MVKKVRGGSINDNTFKIPTNIPINDDHYYKSHLNDYAKQVNTYESSSFKMGGSDIDPNSIDIHILDNYYSSHFNETQNLGLEKNYSPIFDNTNVKIPRDMSNFGISGGSSSNDFKVIKNLLNLIIKISWDDFKNKKTGGDVRNYIQNTDDERNDITNLGISQYEYPKPYSKIY